MSIYVKKSDMVRAYNRLLEELEQKPGYSREIEACYKLKDGATEVGKYWSYPHFRKDEKVLIEATAEWYAATLVYLATNTDAARSLLLSKLAKRDDVIMRAMRSYCARGKWQEDLFDALMAGKKVTNPPRTLKGKAAQYAPNYWRSWRNMLRRMCECGFIIGKEPGPRGGDFRAKYYLM